MPKTLISMGMSCQSAHQLARFANANPTSATFQKGPFDWLICPSNAAAKWLDSELEDFKEDELTVHRDHVWWEKYEFWFWHGFYTKAENERFLEIGSNLKRELSKLSYQRDAFQKLDPDNSIFVLSNTQNNLIGDVFNQNEFDRYTINQSKLDRLQLSLNRYFDSEIDLHLVTREDRSDMSPHANNKVHFLPNEPSQWKGDDAAWNQVLNAILYGY